MSQSAKLSCARNEPVEGIHRGRRLLGIVSATIFSAVSSFRRFHTASAQSDIARGPSLTETDIIRSRIASGAWGKDRRMAGKERRYRLFDEDRDRAALSEIARL